jgi:MoaA/NifB/PqqE/SkfB family radical SAM enzyme
MNKIHAIFYISWLEFKRNLFGIKYFAEVDVTDNCNLRCKHCYHFHGKNEFNFKEIEIEEWEKRFKELYMAGIRFIVLVGGEPALRKDVLKLADSIFPQIYVITNGMIKIEKEFNHLLFLSMEGTQERNDAIRGSGVFSRVISNYSGDSRVVINITLTKDNYKELEDVVKIAKENNFRGVVCNIYTPVIGKDTPLFVSRGDRQLIINELKRVKSIYPKDFLLTNSSIKWYEYPDHTKSCHWGDEALHFDVSWKRRRCFANADCSNCGCMAGAFQNPLKMIRHPREMMKFSI